MSSACFLSGKNHQITVFEKEDFLGGLCATFKKENWQWPLEHYYHHFFSSDKEVFSLSKKLRINKKLSFSPPKSGVYVNNEIHRFDTLKSVMSFPYLDYAGKFRTGFTVFFLKLWPFWQPLEKTTAAKFIHRTMGKKSYELLWKPLLQSKFGNLFESIPASWFWTRIKKRSFGLGYFQESCQTLIDSLCENIVKNGSSVLLKQNITGIQKKSNKFEISIDNKPLDEKFDKVIVTLPPSSFLKITPQLTAQEKNKISRLKSLGGLCLVLETAKQFLPNGIYWLNINDSEFPFVAVVEHTNFVDKKYYGNKPILYIGGYYPQNHQFFSLTKEKIIEKFIPFLQKINPEFSTNEIVSSWLFKNIYTQPVVNLNYSIDTLPQTKTSINGLFWCSLHHVYPEDRGANYAIKLGREIANEILKKN